MKMNKPPSEANSGAGDRSGEGRLGECPKGRASGKSINAKPDRMDGVTESKPSGSNFTTGQRHESDWNRPVQCHGRYSGSGKTAKPHRMDGVKAVRRVVWDRGANYSPEPDSASLFFVVIADLSDLYPFIRNPINQSMLVGYSSRPISRKSVLKRLRLADALIWVIARNILNQLVNLLQYFAIILLPVEVILPSPF